MTNENKEEGLYAKIKKMQELNGNKPSLPPFTKERLMEVLSKVFNSDSIEKVTYDTLRDKVLDGYGYAYTINSQFGKLMTGKGGIINYLDESEKQGIDPWMVGNLITVEGKTLNEVKIVKNGKNI